MKEETIYQEVDFQVCDCTLRDGGYYTNWDFDEELVKMYFNAMHEIPAISYLEIGYRNKPLAEYFGEYFYCPPYVLRLARELCPDKKIAIMLNEKDVRPDDLDELLNPCKGYIHLVRMAVDPRNIERAAELAKAVKEKGFDVGFNLMYMSQWVKDQEFIKKLGQLEGDVDFVYMVDSFGGIYPDEVRNSLQAIKKEINIPVGFHGHNNMELGLANSLTAIENGCAVVDATITGMGRGAGNLKTELLLTCLNAKELVAVDFNKLNPVVKEFEKMQKHYEWGTNFPYMISGAYSLPQKEVMSWIAKNRYTTESIINALQNKKNNLADNHDVPMLGNEPSASKVVIVGGGPNAKKHAHALNLYCKQNPDVVLIHAGVRFVKEFNDLANRQYYCLLGAEGYKLEKSLSCIDLNNVKCVLEPSPREMGTILPDEIVGITYELDEITFMNDYPDSLLTIAFQLSINLKADEISIYGFDGYDMKTEEQMIEVSKENQMLIDHFTSNISPLTSLTPSNYQGFNVVSLYSSL